MLIALGITLFYIIFVWLVFFKLKLLKFNMVWGVVTVYVGAHLMLIFLITLRFYQPYTLDAHVIRPTIQISPWLPEPTLLTEVLVEPNTLVRKGDPLYRFDDTVFRLQAQEAEAQLISAQQNAQILEQDVAGAQQALARSKAQLSFSTSQQGRYTNLVPQGGARQDELDRWDQQVVEDTASVAEADANLAKAQLALASTIDGVNTGIVEAQAALDQANYFLNNTTILAPEDGMIVSQQARPGLVVGIIRAGAIASFVTNEDPYLLATFRQQNLKFVQPGQEVEIALDLYPGDIITGKVKSVWWATSQGQYMPSGRLPEFVLEKLPGRIAVEVTFDDPRAQMIPTGGHAAVAIYTGGAPSFDFLRRINIRIYSFGNFIRPLNI